MTSKETGARKGMQVRILSPALRRAVDRRGGRGKKVCQIAALVWKPMSAKRPVAWRLKMVKMSVERPRW